MSVAHSTIARGNVHPIFASILGAMCPPVERIYAVRAMYQLPADAAVREEHAIFVCAAGTRPDATTLVPKDGELLSALVMPLQSLLDMDLQRRPGHTRLYRAYLLHKAAQKKGKAVSELVSWQDYDPTFIDDGALAWSKGGGSYVYWGD